MRCVRIRSWPRAKRLRNGGPVSFVSKIKRRLFPTGRKTGKKGGKSPNSAKMRSA